MKFSVKNFITGQFSTMELDSTMEQFEDWLYSDKNVQDIFPELMSCEREFLINGLTPKDQSDMDGGCYMACKHCKYNVKQLKSE